MNTGPTKRYYDDFSRTYSDERRGGYFGFINHLEASVLRTEVEGKHVLELGCGTGLMLELVGQFKPASLTGVDLSLGMLSDAHRLEQVVVCGSAMQLPFQDGAFDVVYSFKVLSHVPDLVAALAEVMRVLTPDGVAYLELYNPYSVKGIWDRLRRASGKVFLKHYTLAQVRRFVPAHTDVSLLAGVRVFGPTAGSYRGLIGRFFCWADTVAMHGPFRWLAGYQIYRLQKELR